MADTMPAVAEETSSPLKVVYERLGGYESGGEEREDRHAVSADGDGWDGDPEYGERPSLGESCAALEEEARRLGPYFMLLSLGYMSAWTVIGALVSYYKSMYGAEFFVKLNCAFYLPGLPVSIAQQHLDDKADSRFGSQRTYLARNVASFSFMALALLAFPCGSGSSTGQSVPQAAGTAGPHVEESGGQDGGDANGVLLLTCLIGVASWLCHGCSTMLASMFPHPCLAYLQTGFRMPEIYTLVMVWMLHLGGHPSRAQLRVLFIVTALLCMSGLYAWVVIVRSPAATAFLRMKDGKDCGSALSDVERRHRQRQRRAEVSRARRVMLLKGDERGRGDGLYDDDAEEKPLLRGLSALFAPPSTHRSRCRTSHDNHNVTTAVATARGTKHRSSSLPVALRPHVTHTPPPTAASASGEPIATTTNPTTNTTTIEPTLPSSAVTAAMIAVTRAGERGCSADNHINGTGVGSQCSSSGTGEGGRGGVCGNRHRVSGAGSSAWGDTHTLLKSESSCVDSSRGSGSSGGESVMSVAGIRPLSEYEKTMVEETIWPCRLALFITIWSSIFQASFFAYVRPASKGVNIAEVLYFVRLFSDLVGRPLTRIKPRPSFLLTPWQLVRAAICRLLLTVAFFAYVTLPDVLPQSDAFIILLVAVFSMFSGVLSVLSYEYAASMCEHKALQAYAGSAMNAYFQAAAFTAVLTGLMFIDLHFVT